MVTEKLAVRLLQMALTEDLIEDFGDIVKDIIRRGMACLKNSSEFQCRIRMTRTTMKNLDGTCLTPDLHRKESPRK